MPWPPRIERFRQMVLWESQGLPPDLILAIVKQESGGFIGKKAGTTCKPWAIPNLGGGFIIYNRALGLMQVVPRTIAGYNNRHPGAPVYFEQMSGETLTDARIQIRVGCDVLAKEVRNLHGYDSAAFPGSGPGDADINQLLCAILGYRMGFGALTKKLNKLKTMGLALTYENIKEQFPLWGYNQESGNWVNRPIHYTETIWTAALDHGMEPGAPVDNIPGPDLPETELAGPGGLLAFVVAVGVALALLGKRV